MQRFILAILLVGFHFQHTYSQESEVKKPGAGMALIVDADGLATAEGLVKKGFYYIQILQNDKAKALALTEALGKSSYTGRISLRQESFSASDYGSNLFDLILFEKKDTAPTNILEDMNYLLVPNGIFALKEANPKLTAEATKLGFQSTTIEGYPQALQRSKNLDILPWGPPIELKWKAGARSQIASGYSGICTAKGMLFYLERMEADTGTLEQSAIELFARNAYNGQILWRKTLDGYFHRTVNLVATSNARLFVKDGKNKVYAIDGHTGEKLFDINAKTNNETPIQLLTDKILRVQAKAYSTEDGKFKWDIPTFQYQPLPITIIGERAFFCNATSIYALNVNTGEELWKVPAETIAPNLKNNALTKLNNDLLVRLENIKEAQVTIIRINADNGSKQWEYLHNVKHTAQKAPYRLDTFVKLTTIDQSLLLYYRQNQPGIYKDQINITKINNETGKVEVEDYINKKAGDYHGCFPEIDIGDFIAYYDIWLNKKTLETSVADIPHPACFFGMKYDYGLIYNFPSRKSQFITAVGFQNTKYQKTSLENKLIELNSETISNDSADNGWVFFRGNAQGGNAINDSLGSQLKVAWEKQISTSKPDFGEQNSLRTGISQATAAYGMLYVSDIDGEQVVALDENTGDVKWKTPVNSRIDFPPTIYKGYCFVAPRNGWIYALSAKTGKTIYQLYMGTSGRLIGVQGKLEAEFAATSDVYIQEGVAYVSSDKEGIAFDPATGKVIEAKNINAIASGHGKGGRNLWIEYDMVIKGNTIPRTNEDNQHGFYGDTFTTKLDARVLSFDEGLTVAFKFLPKGEGWANKGILRLSAYENDLKNPKWQSEPIEFLASDILVGKEFIYSVGHYQRIKKNPELWVLEKATGKTVSTIELNSLPGFLGLSAYNKKLYLATRDGKLICLKPE